MLQYIFFAQYDNPPSYLVEKICRGIDGAVEGTYILDKIAAGFHSILGSHCAYIHDLKGSNKSGWVWQVLVLLYIFVPKLNRVWFGVKYSFFT